jgi:protein-S-isoprenylcysteine O-methyltransferase Ste14
MGILQTANLIAFVLCFASFIWAMKYHFRTIENVPFGTRVIQVAGGIFMLAHLLALLRANDVTGLAAVVALFLYGASFTLFWICVRINREKPFSLAFSADQPEHLMTRGPYRYIRHPFYVAYSLGWIAGIVGAGQPWLLLSMLVMGAIYYHAAITEERKFESGELAADYADYRRRAGMFLPRLWPAAPDGARKESA